MRYSECDNCSVKGIHNTLLFLIDILIIKPENIGMFQLCSLTEPMVSD